MIQGILLASAGVAMAFALFAWLQTPPPLLREQLKIAQFWSLECCLVLFLTSAVFVLREIRGAVDTDDLVRLAALSVLALALTLLVAPRTNRIFYDEQIYQSIGQNLADLKLAQMCNDGTVEYGRLQCWSGEYNKQPYAYPHLLSVAYRLFGVSEVIAFRFNALAMVVAVCGVYVLVLLAFVDRAAAFFAGLLLALTPHQILWSATAAGEPSASMACVVALVFAAQFRRSGTTVSLLGTVAATAYAVQFRAESFLIVPVVALLLAPSLRPELRRSRFWALTLLGFALLAVHIAHLFAVRNEGWGASEARLSIGYVIDNLRVNGRFYVADPRFPVVFTALAAIGLLSRPIQPGRRIFALYFSLFFGIYLLFYAGSYNYGADVRYSVMTYPPLAVLGGLGASRVIGWCARLQPAWRAWGAITAALVFQFLWYAPIVRATTEEAWAARADVKFAASLVPHLRGNSYVLTQNPGMFHVWGVNAGQMSLSAQNPAVLQFLDYRYESVYLHWNFWCTVQNPIQFAFCQAAAHGRATQLVEEHRERSQRLALYRISPVSGAK